ncbi:MAG: hypothetical protein WC900_08235 [Oscillospiraceae bacterium]|jgi:hypothetical protein
MREGSYSNGLSDLLDQDLSSYEYFYSLPMDIRQKIILRDINSFEEMQDYVRNLKRGSPS